MSQLYTLALQDEERVKLADPRQHPDHWCREWLDINSGPNSGTPVMIYPLNGQYYWEAQSPCACHNMPANGPFATSQLALADIYGEGE